jgi:hypothetical protein
MYEKFYKGENRIFLSCREPKQPSVTTRRIYCVLPSVCIYNSIPKRLKEFRINLVQGKYYTNDPYGLVNLIIIILI